MTRMSENKYHFERLTPIDSINLNMYEEAIDFVFNHSDDQVQAEGR